MASFEEFLAVLAEAWPDPSERGTRFEPFLRDAISMSPSHQFKHVWLWDDWPGRDGPEPGLGGTSPVVPPQTRKPDQTLTS